MTRSTCFLAALCFATTAFPFSPTASAGQAESTKHPFHVDDWAALRAASPVAVSPDGQSVLYDVRFGGAKGPDNHEWHMISIDGTHSKKLELPEHFTPFGFTRAGASLYGGPAINKLQQFAVFPLADLKASSTPSLTVLLPRGIEGAIASPDGSRFAILADPRPPDPLTDVHTVVEPHQTALHVVNANGTEGKWWCPELKNIASGDISSTGASVAWSPDGASLAVLSLTLKIGFHYIKSTIDVCTAASARRVTEQPNVISGLTWTTGGKELAFLSTTNSVLTPDHVWTVPSQGGTAKDQTPNLKGSAMAITGDPHGRIWVLMNNGVQNEVDAFQAGVSGPLTPAGTLTPAWRWPDGIIKAPPIFSVFASARDQADPNRLAIFGWSAGGFMTAWTVTQTTRYRAAIEGAGSTDWASFLWTSDIQQFDYDARWPDEDPAVFQQFSAVFHVAKVTTPLLILHGAADLRVQTFQGRELFEVLAARGKTTRLVTYPGSPHFPRLWEQRRDVFNEVAAWLAKYNP